MKFKYPYLWSFWRKLTWPFLGAGSVLLLQVGLVVVLPLPAKFIIDKIIKAGPNDLHNITLKGFYLGEYNTYDGLVFLSALTLFLCMLQILAEWLEGKTTTNMVYITAERIRKDLFQKIFTRRQSYLDSKKKVDILGRISGDISNLENVIVFGLPAIIRAIPTMITLLITMFFINVKFTLIFCSCLPIFYFFIHFYTAKMRDTAKKMRRKIVTFEEEIYESASSMAIVKSLKGEKKVLQKIIDRSSEVTITTGLFRDASLLLESSVGSTHHVVRAGLLFMGGLAILRGELTFGDLYVFMSYLNSISRPMNDITKFLSRLAKTTASMDRIEELESELNEFPEISGDQNINTSSASPLEFNNLTFSYTESKDVFLNYNLKFPEKNLISVVGQSGIGKSSFSRLLNRLQDPISGSILLGGKNLKDFKLDELRNFIRILSQETFLISGTIRENLTLAAKEDTPDEDLYNALESVNALGFVKALPLGLDTVIGEGGQQLSGGQAKRIHLARGFLDLESEILVFDEPTTGLDTLSSKVVMDSLHKIAQKKKLVFWITHRMQEVHNAQNILFFLPGSNPIFASHDELSKNNTHYRALLEQKDEEPKQSPPISVNELDRTELESITQEIDETVI